MSATSSVSPKMVVGVVFVALIIIVMMFVFRRHGCDPLHMNTATLQPSATSPPRTPSPTITPRPTVKRPTRNAWVNAVSYKVPAERKVVSYYPLKIENTAISLSEAVTTCKSRGYCERVQSDGSKYIFFNWPSLPPPCNCKVHEEPLPINPFPLPPPSM
jgi:hypothetical protein